uniref:Uncharacterized protein n=1 Tax=Parascaris equorum TaxID=6256 RepID=A0A914RN79_PAREQ
MVAAVSEAAARRRQTSAFSSLASEDVEDNMLGLFMLSEYLTIKGAS